MTALTHNTRRSRLVGGALLGIVLFEAVAVVWAIVDASRAVVFGAVALAIVGGAGGALIAWMTEPNRWDRWWADHRRRPAGSRTSVPPPDEIVERSQEPRR
jgi:hypothetical protein